MLIFMFYKLTVDIFLLLALYNLIAVSLNCKLSKQITIMISIILACSNRANELICETGDYQIIFNLILNCVAIFVIYKPKKIMKFLVLSIIGLSYILLERGFSYLFQRLYFLFLGTSFVSVMFYYFVELIFILVIAKFIELLIKAFYFKRSIMNFMYDMELKIGDVKINLKMYLDSGNSLYDQQTGLPIVIVSKKSLEQHIKKKLNLSKLRKVSYTTLNGEDFLPAFRPTSLTLKTENSKELINAMVGIVDKQFNDYDGLLNVAVC